MAEKQSRSARLKRYPKMTDIHKEMTRNSMNVDYALRDAPKSFSAATANRKSRLAVPTNRKSSLAGPLGSHRCTQTLDEWRRKSTGSSLPLGDLVKEYLKSPLALAGNKLSGTPEVRDGHTTSRLQAEKSNGLTIKSHTFIDDKPRQSNIRSHTFTLLTKSSSLVDIAGMHLPYMARSGQFSTHGITGSSFVTQTPEIPWRLKKSLSEQCLFDSSQLEANLPVVLNAPRPEPKLAVARSDINAKKSKREIKQKSVKLIKKSNRFLDKTKTAKQATKSVPSVIQRKVTQVTCTVATQTDDVESESDDDTQSSLIN